ncbi:MAG: FAD/NAD(P)-binding protein, partial [Polyangiaceae bacterium]
VGVVLPPWLGVRRSRAEALSQKVGIRCGEALVGLASASGARFEHARDLALSGAQVEVVAGWAKSIVSASGTWRVVLEDGEPLEADAVVIAAGGLVGGGLVYSPGAAANAAELPPDARPTLRVGVAAPVVLGSRGSAALRPSTLFGAPPEAIAWPFATDPWIERAGILVAEGGAALDAPSGLFAAGDVTADAPRAWLATFERGATAGAAAARSSAR